MTLRVLLVAILALAHGYVAPLGFARSSSPALRRRALAPLAQQPSTDDLPKASETNAEAEDGSGGLRQLLGLKGASAGDEKAFLNWKIRLQLTKPATWVPLIWGVACGAAASGNFHALWNLFGDAPTTDSVGVVATDAVKAFCAMVLAGPFMCGFTQTINDWSTASSTPSTSRTGRSRRARSPSSRCTRRSPSCSSARRVASSSTAGRATTGR